MKSFYEVWAGIYDLDDGLSWCRDRLALSEVQYDNMIVVKGMMKIVLYDSRMDSPTYKEVNEFFLGDQYNPQLLQIPPLVFHGFKCISESEALVINIPTEVYNYSLPDEYRVPPHG